MSESTSVPRAKTTSRAPEDLTTVQLIERLSAQLGLLVRSEMANAVGELKAKGGRFGSGIGATGAGVLFALFGVATLVAAAVLGLATALDPWLAALIVGIVILLVGGAVAGWGAMRAKRAVPPVPTAAVESVRDDISVVKEHVG